MSDDTHSKDLEYDSDGCCAPDSSQSLSDSILAYRELHGRALYNAETSEPWGPNKTQSVHLDVGHHMYTLLLDNNLFLAPIDSNVERVIDIGTGTGLWAIDFAEMYPSANVIGTEISPVEPVFAPPNVYFGVEDAQLEWIHGENTFDFVHIRQLMGGIKDWAYLFEQAFKCMKPGGWIESFEIDIQWTSDDGSVAPGDMMYEWSRKWIDAGESIGRTLKIARYSKRLLEEAGFVGIVEKKFKLPLGGWMQDPTYKEIGKCCLLFMDEGLEDMVLYLGSAVLEWDPAKIEDYVAQMRRAIKDKENHGYIWATVVYGQKPDL